ncbi:Uma2 family endonuclease [Kribbella sp. NPDC054772]
MDQLEPYTLEYLDSTPDDGGRREIVDGGLFVTPAPSRLHQRAVTELCFQLKLASPGGMDILVAPFDYRPTSQRSLQPDVLVCSPDDTDPQHARKPLALAVEILSPSTRMVDLLLKRGVYEQAGVRSYWILDPEKESLTVLELVDGVYVERDVVTGEKVFDAVLPFPVQIVPAELFRAR